MLKPDTEVDVVVSKGPRPIVIDDFTGEPAADARKSLEADGFRVVVAGRRFSGSVDAGSVIGQAPSAGTGFRGDRIELVVSKGPELVAVPELLGASASDAAAQLDALGLEVNEVRFFGDSDTVVRQSPGAGEMVSPGTTVTIYLV
jgi:serine/threonine-protein kinase